jgi:hypothetical protein
MKTIKNIIVLLLTFVFLNNNSQAQEIQNLQIAVEKATGKIILTDKLSNTIVSADFQVKIADIDIYKKNEYVGSLHFENGLLNSQELKPEETIKVAHVQLVFSADKKILDFKDVEAILK